MGTAGGFPPNRTVPVGLPLKRVLHDPVTLLTGASAAFSVIGGIAGGAAADRQGQAEASFLEAQAQQEQLAKERDLTDFDRESGRALARSRAVIAASGGDTTTGGALDLLSYQSGVFGENRQRLINDSDARIRGLNARADSARSAGQSAQWASIFSGFGKGLSMGSSLFGNGAVSVPRVGSSGAAAP